MRIISGTYRGMKLVPFQGDDIRPTSDRAKEALFDILSPVIPGARVLDLFCGSGGLGIECLSRGAAEAHFNDSSRESLAVLKANLSRLKGGEKYMVTCSDFAACLRAAARPYDLIFLDPPYRTGFGLDALRTISGRGLLTERGVAVYERDRPFDGAIDGLEKYDERRYGKTYLTFFERMTDE